VLGFRAVRDQRPSFRWIERCAARHTLPLRVLLLGRFLQVHIRSVAGRCELFGFASLVQISSINCCRSGKRPPPEGFLVLPSTLRFSALTYGFKSLSQPIVRRHGSPDGFRIVPSRKVWLV
jgi:hypothetical protein